MSQPQQPGPPRDESPIGWSDLGPATWSPVPQQQMSPDPWWPPAAYADLPAPQPLPAPLPGGLPTAVPDGERTYPQMLRGPRRRWWRPLLALLVAGAIALVGQFVAFVPFLVFGVIATGGSGVGQWFVTEFNKLAVRDIDAAGFFYTNLTLIALIPAAGLSIWIVHHIRPKFVSAVTGGFRWRWLLRCLAVVVPVWALYTVAVVLLGGSTATDRPDERVLLLVLVVVMTPLQAAGEEYFFRGWILQNVGSWFKRPMLSLVVGTAVSATAFSAAHGSPDPWILGSLAVFAISCCLLTWRTGGLEAGIAIHAVNNIAAFFAVINVGGWNEAFVGGQTKGNPAQFGIDVLIQVIAFALIWWQAKRAKITSTYRPAPAAATDPRPA